jgi:hypothetical protein
MQLNTTTVVDRHNRPTVIQKVALRAFFINDGQYYDPYDISGVTIFKKTANESPSSVLDGNVIAESVTSGSIVMQFGASANDDGAALDPTSYNPDTDTKCLSGVYRVKAGEYVCVLDGTQSQPFMYNFYASGSQGHNSASSVDDYIDCWTIQFAETSDYQTLINGFHLYNDTFFATTQAVMLTTNNRLVNKHLTLDSKENLKVTTEVTINNRDIDESVKNIFKDSAITSAMMKIEKINDDSVALPSHITVSGYSDTSSTIDVTSDNTIVFNFDTTTLATHPNVAQFAGLTGNYRVTVKYILLNETIISPPYYFTVS